MNPDIKKQPANVEMQESVKDDIDNTTADADAVPNTETVEQLAGIDMQSSANGRIHVVTSAVGTLNAMEQQPVQTASQSNSHDDIINTTTDATVEMKTADGGAEITPREHPTDQWADLHSLANTAANSSGGITSDFMERQPTKLHTEPRVLDVTDNITPHGGVRNSLHSEEQRVAELQTQPYPHDNVDDTRTDDGVEITSGMTEQHLTESQTDPYLRDGIANTTGYDSEDLIDMRSTIEEPQCEVQNTTPPEVDVSPIIPDPKTYHGIREYINSSPTPSGQSWLSLPELPTAQEVASFSQSQPATVEHLLTPNDIELNPNKIDGAWEDKEQYLSTHYELLREDAVAPLREAVLEFHARPYIMERDSKEHIAIYEQVYIKGLTFAQQGVAVRVCFSLRRAEKLIRWEQSKRLISGTIVALTHAEDKFDTICKVAVVAARPLTALYTNPPTVELYFNSVDELELDPQQEWIMIEARSGYYEANRHILRALQKMSTEEFPLAEHIVDLQTTVEAPEYVVEAPWKEMSPALTNQNQRFGIDVLEDWPDFPEPKLDESQLAALHRILTKRLAVVQGPPGTGKTHVSVVALKIMRGNMAPTDPPIIVTAQTNHALDQLLRHISGFEPNFIRLGGRTADKDLIKPRTLYSVRKSSSQPRKSVMGAALEERLKLSTQLRSMLDPLINGTEPLTAEVLHSYGLMSQAQLDSLIDSAAKMTTIPVTGLPGLIAMWMEDYLIPANIDRHDDYSNLKLEEPDLAFEQLKDLEAESGGGGDGEAFELLRGEYVALVEPWTGHDGQIKINDKKIEELLKARQDLWRIPEMYRGSVYSYWQRKFKEILRKRVRAISSLYMRACQNLKVVRWERDVVLLRKAKIIGMTTTGLSKYRGLITSLKPKVVLIEEAAETIEANVTAACFESLQHLVLVGDHQQLRGHCAVPELEGHPWNLAVSLFERLVRNNVEYSQLTRQRRMRPEIRQFISPIYPNLEDHPCVENRQDVPGMGGFNCWFMSHKWYESNDNHMSKRNLEEAEMIVGLFDYLVHNGMEAKHITVLTFYNGQRKLIHDLLRKHPNFQGHYEFKVVTVDSYQGEENEVVLLSLVRNNRTEIGFLGVDNRICVALSRARRGFYIFGNHGLLSGASKLWLQIIKILSTEPKRIGAFLPIACTNHGQRLNIHRASDWLQLNGGCASVCQARLTCGHACPSTCHPFPHAHIQCRKPCRKRMPGCNHPCLEECHVQQCRCQCRKSVAIPPVPFQCLTDDPFVRSQAGPSSQAPKDNSYGAAFPHLTNIASRSASNSAAEWKAWKNWKPAPAKQTRKQAATLRPSPAATPRIASQSIVVGAPSHGHQHEQSAPLQAWGDFAAGGHMQADERIQAANVEKLAAAEKQKRETKWLEKAAEERRWIDEENERLLFGGDEQPARTDQTAATSGEQLTQTETAAITGEKPAQTDQTALTTGDQPEPMQTDVTAASNETPRVGGGRVRRVEVWRPASEPSEACPPTLAEDRKEEVSLMDMENEYLGEMAGLL